MFALGLHTSLKHRVVWISSHGMVMADTCFFMFLKKRDFLRSKDLSDLVQGDLVTYVDQHFNLPIHIGVATAADRVKSKWGMGGLLVEHQLLEVPAAYGSPTEAYCQPDASEVEDLLDEYGNFIQGVSPSETR